MYISTLKSNFVISSKNTKKMQTIKNITSDAQGGRVRKRQ